VKFSAELKVRGLPIIYVHREGQMHVGSRCRFNSGYRNNFVGGEQKLAIQVLPDAALHIGNRVALSNSTLVCAFRVTIDDDVFIGGGCHIYDTDFHSLKVRERISKENEQIRMAPIHIERQAFIGSHVVIVRGVTIGECSIVAAGSVVAQSIPARQLWGGAPAKFIRELTDEECDQL
jgi:acetyltransferase-like isoleucine patch superfamily enzyme